MYTYYQRLSHHRVQLNMDSLLMVVHARTHLEVVRDVIRVL